MGSQGDIRIKVIKKLPQFDCIPMEDINAYASSMLRFDNGDLIDELVDAIDIEENSSVQEANV